MRSARGVAISVFCCAIVIYAVTACADTHWANPAGANVPPYSSYATGAHYLQDAVAAAADGDTIRLAAGEYDLDTTIYSPSNSTWIGAGRDSVTISWVDLKYQAVRMIKLKSNTEVCGLRFLSPMGSRYYMAIDALFLPCCVDSGLTVHDCRFQDCSLFSDGSGHQEIYSNEFYVGYAVGITFAGYRIWIHDNVFHGTGGTGILIFFGNYPVIEHNVFMGDGGSLEPVFLDHASFVEVRNNLMVNTSSPVTWYFASGVVENNTIIGATGTPYGGSPVRYIILVYLRDYETLLVRNNAMMNFVVPWEFGPDEYAVDTTGLITFVNNVFWPPKDVHYRRNIDYPEWQVKLLDSANYEYYPMFADDSVYQLQAGSPLIDAGDAAELDANGSRSDIGWTGGPGGWTYAYPQAPPEPPESLWAAAADGYIILTWTSRPEADLSGYRLYRGDAPDFWYPALAPIAEIDAPDTTWNDYPPQTGVDWYYVVTARDTAGLESEPSPEGHSFPTGIFEDPYTPPLPLAPHIQAVYPNPFNSSTVIGIFIPAVGASPVPVELSMYDVLGRRIATAFVGNLDYGSHDIEWNARTTDGNPLPSGVYFAFLRVWGRTFEKPAKLVLLK